MHVLSNNINLFELKLYEVFENLRIYEEDVAESINAMKKKTKTVNDPIALVAEKEEDVRYTPSSRRSDVSEGESNDDMDREIMMENLLSVTNNF